jgi:hypothetical protein
MSPLLLRITGVEPKLALIVRTWSALLPVSSIRRTDSEMKMQVGKRWLRLYVVVVLGLFAMVCSAHVSVDTPQVVVDKYLSLDAQGANFSASNPNAKLIWQLLINEDEAGYDESVVIKSYRIGKSKVGVSSADVEVIYEDLGTIGGELHVKKQQRSESVTFHLTKTGNEWKIDGLRIPPHISQAWMQSKLHRNLVADQKAGKDDPNLKDAIAQISRW